MYLTGVLPGSPFNLPGVLPGPPFNLPGTVSDLPGVLPGYLFNLLGSAFDFPESALALVSSLSFLTFFSDLLLSLFCALLGPDSPADLVSSNGCDFLLSFFCAGAVLLVRMLLIGTTGLLSCGEMGSSWSNAL